jgi:RNA polymerase sigma-70 factor (ECF subfamily)
MGKSGATTSGRPAAGNEPVPRSTVIASAGDDPLVILFNQLRDELVSTLMYVLGNADDAQDAAQEAFLKCWRARHTMGEVQNMRAWVFRVGLNAAKDFRRSAWHRRSRPLPEDDLMLPAHEDVAGQSLEDRETVDRLRTALADLRQDEKEVFLLRQNGELTYEQIAEMRNAPVGTVKTQMRAALQKLRKVLNPEPSVGSVDREN